MTGTPSKDRAEAIAREFADYTDRSRWGSLHLVHQERLAEVLAEVMATSFAEGMKRAAEIARDCEIVTPLGAGLPDGASIAGRQIVEAILAEIGER